MKRLLALALCLTLGAPAVAFELEDMTEAERQTFRAEIRAYLMENPEVLMEAFAVLEERQAAAEAEAAEMAIAANGDLIYSSAFDWVGGNPDGDIVVVEFIDYRCGFCRRAHPEVNALLETDGSIRLVVKEFPILGEESVLASRFAIATRLALGDEAYEQVHHALIEMRGNITEASLVGMAAELGLNANAIMGSLHDPVVQATLQTNRDLATRLGISGTPSFIFEDQLVRGYVPFDGMVQLVAELRAEAE